MIYNDEWPLRKNNEDDFSYGKRVGFDDNFIPHWQLAKYSPDFQKGYREGKAVIDELVDIAAQRQFSYERD